MRNDIQFLRGVAVLIVVLYHAKTLSIPNGFLGVDIFFVVSGFLITSMILRDLDDKSFSFKQFYIRRARRLLPAAYSTLILTTLLSYELLTKSQWNDYIAQLIGAITFTANLVLPFQTGYFEAAAEGKPLLHIWSLSLEEQYYLLMPLFLSLLAVKWRGWFLAAGIIFSLFLCILFISFPFSYWRFPGIDSKMLAFYLLPTRAWELLIGSFVAWAMIRSPLLTIPSGVKSLAFAMLLIPIFYPFDNIHPRGGALIVVLATAIILIGRDNWLPSHWMISMVKRVGDWSYSLYLIHWPLFAFAQHAYLGIVPVYVMWLLLFLSLALAYLQYEFIEQRFRSKQQMDVLGDVKETYRWLIGSSVVMLLLAMPIIAGYKNDGAGYNDFQYIFRHNRGLNDSCAQGKIFVEPILACMTSNEPLVAVWGDSYAMHLLPGLKVAPVLGSSLVQITKSACAPILGVALINAKYDELWAQTCIDFNEKALKYIQDNQSIKYVILSSSFSGYFDDAQLQLFVDGKKVKKNGSIAVARMIKTIEELRRSGKRPIIVAPPPTTGFNIAACLERQVAGLMVLSRSDCNFLVADYKLFQRDIITALEKIEQLTAVDIVWLDEVICEEGICLTIVDGVYLYRDQGHLSVAGSELLIPLLNLTDQIIKIPH